MATFAGIAAAGKSVERFLNLAFDQGEPLASATKAILARGEDFDLTSPDPVIRPPALSILFYRVDFNKTMRAAWSAVGSQNGQAHLPLDMHFLITPWSSNAEFEMRILGRAMQALEATPILSGPMLHPEANWTGNESLQIVLEELPTEALMRLFDTLPIDYRLSVPYIARIVRVDARTAQTPPVTTLVTGKIPF